MGSRSRADRPSKLAKDRNCRENLVNVPLSVGLIVCMELSLIISVKRYSKYIVLQISMFQCR